MYYSYDKIVSYDALLNFVITERGLGKSYGAKKLVINNFLKKGEEFVYLRRFKTELETSVPKWFDDIKANNEFPEHELKVKYSKKLSEFKCDGVTCGYAVPLSTANILKSTSFANVKTIVFDEFLLAGSGQGYYYLRREVEQFLDVIETIARLRDVKVFLLGNASSVTNPYFSFFGLSLPYGGEFKTFKDGLIVVNYAKNSLYRDKKKASRFGRLIAGTKYGDYAIDNKMLLDDRAFVHKKSGNAKIFSSVVIDGKTVGIWRDSVDGYFYVSDDFDPNCPNVFALDTKDHDERTIYLNAKKNTWFRLLIQAYQHGRLCFENQVLKNKVLPYIVGCLTN